MPVCCSSCTEFLCSVEVENLPLRAPLKNVYCYYCNHCATVVQLYYHQTRDRELANSLPALMLLRNTLGHVVHTPERSASAVTAMAAYKTIEA